ncbi:YkgJ family cysteine cluster protein [Oceanidesulfovibrio marinus]|uniref:Zinc/iron-chelating domain-containing protein n=1 Tax=Oceanidesulfovibrio marinus TaxID=370038 RepID=A0ABX6NDY4_9BACT|nr:hypothetical protein [Oceanidesulfovibrio marinus]QJT08803.1 hypothetical protein E8L03_07630 [Oceanidesulfovibrio marinus]
MDRPEPPETPHVCARCARCCVITPEEKPLVFPLFPLEIERLNRCAEELGIGPSWLEHEPNTPEFLSAMLTLFPDNQDAVRTYFPISETHPRLGVLDDGRCVFLGDAGCMLSQDDRPAHCLLFPLWVARGRIRPLDAQCLAIQGARRLSDILEVLNLTEESLYAAHANLCRAWGL